MKNIIFNSKHLLGRHIHCKNTKLGYKCNIAYGADICNSNVGKRSSIGRYTTVRDCQIGNFCAISWNCSLGAKNHHYEMVSCSAAFFQQRFGIVDQNIKNSDGIVTTSIGNDVWIGCNAVILSGVTVGDGAVIGAGAIVTKDVEAYSIVVGVPAKHIRYRFNNKIRNNLHKSKWWLWEDDILKRHSDLFHQEMTEELSELILNVSKQIKAQI